MHPDNVSAEYILPNVCVKTEYICDDASETKSPRREGVFPVMCVVATPPNRFPCRFCPKTFRRRCDVKDHEESHAKCGALDHPCVECGKSYTTRTGLSRHRSFCHGDDAWVPCDGCGKTFRNRHVLSYHQRSVHEGDPCLCETCGKVCKNKIALWHHLRFHQREPSECDVCGKTFASRIYLQRHKLRSHRQSSACEQCGKTFTNGVGLKLHVRTHTGEKPYQCRFCAKAFARRHNWKVHERVHTGERPYECATCSRRFTQNHVLRCHQKTCKKTV